MCDIEIYKAQSIARKLNGLQTSLNSYKLEANLGINLKTNLKEEAFLILKGKGILNLHGQEKNLEAGDMFKIPPNTSFKILALSDIKFIRSTKTEPTKLKIPEFDKIEFQD